MQTSLGTAEPRIYPPNGKRSFKTRPSEIARRPAVRKSLRMCAYLCRRLFCCTGMVTFLIAIAGGTEHGACVYPVGIETVLPGLTPKPGGTMLYGYSLYYTAGEFDNSRGKSSVPVFKLNAYAFAFKVVHNWNLHVLGGTLDSNIAVPFVDEHLHLPDGKFGKFSMGNISIGVLELGYAKGGWHWLYEVDGYLPGAAYSKNDVLNVE